MEWSSKSIGIRIYVFRIWYSMSHELCARCLCIWIHICMNDATVFVTRWASCLTSAHDTQWVTNSVLAPCVSNTYMYEWCNRVRGSLSIMSTIHRWYTRSHELGVSCVSNTYMYEWCNRVRDSLSIMSTIHRWYTRSHELGVSCVSKTYMC